ncbi:hypothetical protein CHH57_01460 [Niallia circulans]|uniref:Pectate lyase superfamily protein domain-containing protein n=1 Tax=Niallia circulans TaxID=1397 RepID=A0AA91TWQ8_NIACI|nr:hypothetical protein [Niallia circulans]PAD85006.1 hypothetical protein CHH57_01460 [Niallia circulans]
MSGFYLDPNNSDSKIKNINKKIEGFISLEMFGAKIDEESPGYDSTAAFIKAINFFNGGSGKLKLSKGTYNFSSQLNLGGIILEGSGIQATKLRLTKSLGTNVPAIITNPSTLRRECTLRDFSLVGKGSWVIGTKNANGDGIQIIGSQKIENVRVERFDKGVIIDTIGGHCSLVNVKSTNNFYNLFIQKDNGDNFYFDCDFSGAQMASIGVSSDANMSGGGTILRTHVGFAPYGIYQEQGTATNKDFIVDVLFDHVRFESIGNAAIYTEQYSNINGSGISNSKFIDVGFSWNSSYKIQSRVAESSVVVGYCHDVIIYEPGLNPFKGNGSNKAFKIAQNTARWIGKFNVSDFPFTNLLYPNDITIKSLNGSTSGSMRLHQSIASPDIKTYVVRLSNFKHDADANLTLSFDIPFVTNPYILNPTDIPISVTRNDITISKIASGLVYNSNIIIQGV